MSYLAAIRLKTGSDKCDDCVTQACQIPNIRLHLTHRHVFVGFFEVGPDGLPVPMLGMRPAHQQTPPLMPTPAGLPVYPGKQSLPFQPQDMQPTAIQPGSFVPGGYMPRPVGHGPIIFGSVMPRAMQPGPGMFGGIGHVPLHPTGCHQPVAMSGPQVTGRARY